MDQVRFRRQEPHRLDIVDHRVTGGVEIQPPADLLVRTLLQQRLNQALEFRRGRRREHFDSFRGNGPAVGPRQPQRKRLGMRFGVGQRWQVFVIPNADDDGPVLIRCRRRPWIRPLGFSARRRGRCDVFGRSLSGGAGSAGVRTSRRSAMISSAIAETIASWSELPRLLRLRGRLRNPRSPYQAGRPSALSCMPRSPAAASRRVATPPE